MVDQQSGIPVRGEEQEVKIKGIPEEWLEKYSIMRTRVPNPIVSVKNGSCSACFHALTQQDMLNLQRRKLLQCRDCYRFLYIESPHVTQQQS